MSEQLKPAKRRKWLRRSFWTLGALLLLFIVTAFVLKQSGFADEWARKAIVSEIEKASGGKAELTAFRFQLWSVRAEMEGFTLHGREPEGTPPLFAADRIVVDVRVDSLWRKKFSLDEVLLTRPRVHIRMDEQGRSNIPGPHVERESGKPVQQQIFDFIVRKVRIEDGELLFNDVRIPLVAEGDEMNFALDYHAPAPPATSPGTQTPEKLNASFSGAFSWNKVKFAARRYIPFESNIQTRFTLTRENFTLDSFRLILPKSEIEAHAELESFTNGAWNFRYRARLNLEDIRQILRKPAAPAGIVDLSGEGNYAARKIALKGRYAARGIDLNFHWFDTDGIESRGDYVVDNNAVVVQPFHARAVGGEVDGRVDLALDGLKFRVTTRATGLDLAKVLDAIDHPGFPIASLHWDAKMDVDSVLTWERDFKEFDAQGTTEWKSTAPAAQPVTSVTQPADNSRIPVDARIPFHYSARRKGVDLGVMTISTPTSRIKAQGVLAESTSGLDVDFFTSDLLPWNDFINALSGRLPKVPRAFRAVGAPQSEEQTPWRIAGQVSWKGRITRDIEKPTFAGRVEAMRAAYNDLKWDEVTGELTYSPTQFRLERGKVRRGKSAADFDVWLEQSNWSFCDTCSWTAEANLERTPVEGLQELTGVNYPVQGLLTGQFRGSGTRENPVLSGLVDINEAQAWGFPVDRVRGKIELSDQQLRIANAEVRVGTGRITGNFLYKTREEQVEFDLAGAVIPIERLTDGGLAKLQPKGQLSFQWKGSGPLRAPVSEGTMRIVDLIIGDENVGSFEATLRADGRQLRAEINSAMQAGKLTGKVEMTLGGEYPLHGNIEAANVDVDALIKSGLRLDALTGHSSVDGRFEIAGALARPETISVKADLSRVNFDYRYVKLANDGPVRFSYSRDEIRVEQVKLKGTNTDLKLAGFLRFTGDRKVGLELTGDVDLAIVGGFLKNVETRGAANVNGTVEGTLDNPRVVGSLRVTNASASFTEFPTGVSQLNGTFVFDRTRMLFENVRAEAGGGRLILEGAVTYGDGPFRYELSARANSVRIRYPEGMSWHADASLRYVGTLQGATLSGRVAIERALLSKGLDFGSLLGGENGGGAGGVIATTNYLRNLQFDLQVVSSPDARLEWTEARFDTEANLRVRGTWEHPVLLGQIRLLSGDITFRGNRYRLTRGDLNFTSPFRLDPTINIEAVSRIRQYEISLTLTGTASKLALAYRSDPPLPSADIIALLALGRTADETERRTVGTVQGQDFGAGVILSEAVSSLVGGQVERLFGISRFRIDPFRPADSPGQNTSARITIEQQVTRDLVITYITNVTSTEQQVIQVEYTVNRDISIIGRRDENGTIGLDVKFTKRFK